MNIKELVKQHNENEAEIRKLRIQLEKKIVSAVEQVLIEEDCSGMLQDLEFRIHRAIGSGAGDRYFIERAVAKLI